jgi:hypothetical protein
MLLVQGRGNTFGGVRTVELGGAQARRHKMRASWQVGWSSAESYRSGRLFRLSQTLESTPNPTQHKSRTLLHPVHVAYQESLYPLANAAFSSSLKDESPEPGDERAGTPALRWKGSVRIRGPIQKQVAKCFQRRVRSAVK